MNTSPTAPADGDGLRIADLARVTGVSVRNIREYQDRGLLPPPRREGRFALYSQDHVPRLQLIDRLLRRGYTLTVIGELLEAWAGGRDLGDVLGLETVASEPWTDEAPGAISLMELRRMFGWQLTPGVIRRAIRMGILIAKSPRAFHAPSPSLIDSGAQLVAAGIPLRTVLDVIEKVRTEIETPADRLIDMVFQHVVKSETPDGMPLGDELPQVTETVARLRPHAQRTVETLFGQALSRAVDRAFADLAERAIDAAVTSPADGSKAPRR